MTPMMLKLNNAMREISGFDFADFHGVSSIGGGVETGTGVGGYTEQQLRELR